VEPFEIVREVPLTAAEAFARVTDWSRHGAFVPLTSIRLTDTGFVAHTGVGPLGFDDPMDVVEWDPPRFCRLEKRGRVVRGWAEITVDPLDLGSRITWRELARTRGVVGPLTRVEAALGRRLFDRLLAGLTRT
jgi:hypothetical protein